jgi:glycosyltransferase involved in cell wall biosynthesis
VPLAGWLSPMSSGSRRRLAIVVSHPIQYFSHVYRRMSQCANLDVKVFYGSKIGLHAYQDPGFGVELSWDCDLVGGFNHEFLPGSERVRRLNWHSLAGVRVVDALERFAPDAVLLHGYSQPHVLRAWRWGRAHQRRLILFGDGNGRQELQRSAPRRLVKRMALGPLLRTMDHVLSLGEANELYWSALGVEPSRVQWAPLYLPSPEVVVPAGDRKEAIRAAVRAELAVDEGQILVICSGKFVPWKRTVDLVRAVDRSDRLVGLYVGDGTCRRACETEARTDRHRFVGFANVPKLAQYYAASDMLCHPADREPYGLVVAEAAASGLPIVASRVVGAVGARSHGQPGRNAVVFAPGDINDLTDKLSALVADPERRRRMSAESVRVAEEMERACYRGLGHCIGGVW